MVGKWGQLGCSFGVCFRTVDSLQCLDDAMMCIVDADDLLQLGSDAQFDPCVRHGVGGRSHTQPGRSTDGQREGHHFLICF